MFKDFEIQTPSTKDILVAANDIFMSQFFDKKRIWTFCDAAGSDGDGEQLPHGVDLLHEVPDCCRKTRSLDTNLN